MLRVAFGSCYGYKDHDSNIFETVVKDDPDLFIWLGDVAYIDLKQKVMPLNYVNMRFKMTSEAPGYSQLLESSAVIGVWDDHDYGMDNSGRHFEFRD